MTEKGICPIQTVFGILGGKWKHRILLELHPGPMRYNQLAASIGTISYKVLTQQLRELEEDGLVCRKVYPEVPPRVEYALTEMGKSIFVVFREMRRWGLECDPVHKPVCSHCWKCRGREENASGSADA